jgi:RNA polymerase sigma factor (sigma-70 family)
MKYLGLDRYQVLSREDETTLLTEYARTKDPRIRDRLVMANMRYVIQVAKKRSGPTMPEEDLVQEGAIGLTEAIEKFDLSRGCKLLTFAVWYIRSRMQRHTYKMIQQVKRLTTVGARVAWCQGRFEIVRDLSLNETLGDSGAEHQDMLEDDTDLMAEIIEAEERADIRCKAIGAAEDERERSILSNRTLAEDPKTLREIGERMGVSRERVRQIEKRMLSRLRATC